MPRSASVVSRKGKGWCAGSGCTWTGSVTDMGMSHSSSTRTILPCGPGEPLPAGLLAPPLASPSSGKLFVSSAASLTHWSVSQKRTWCIPSLTCMIFGLISVTDARYLCTFCLQRVLLLILAARSALRVGGGGGTDDSELCFSSDHKRPLESVSVCVEGIQTCAQPSWLI